MRRVQSGSTSKPPVTARAPGEPVSDHFGCGSLAWRTQLCPRFHARYHRLGQLEGRWHGNSPHVEGNSPGRRIARLSEQVKWVRGHVTDLASDPLIDTLHMLIKSLTTPSALSAPATLLGTPDLRPLAQATDHNPHLGMQVLGPATTEAAPLRHLECCDIRILSGCCATAARAPWPNGRKITATGRLGVRAPDYGLLNGPETVPHLCTLDPVRFE